MTDEQINVTIARLCGWSGPTPPFHLNDAEMSQPPDYVNDLNACAQFELSLTDAEHKLFRHCLLGITDDGDKQYAYRESRNYASATARQRAEAFLRLKGEWKV